MPMTGASKSTFLPPLLRAAAVGCFAALLGCGTLAAKDGTYEPMRGQHGKDVVWIATPDELVERMLELAQVKPDDFVVDLGSGDGKIVIAAARDFGARGLGLEYDEKLVEFARRNAQAAGVSDRAEFRQADIFKSDFSHADVVTMYLLPDLNLRLRSTLMAMKPGTRVVSHQFSMGNWRADETSTIQGRPAYLWIVPANAGGAWQATYVRKGAPASVEFTLEQVFQDLTGAAQFDKTRTTLRNPTLRGPEAGFGFTDADGVQRQVHASIEGNRMQGRIVGPEGSSEFSAQRKGDAPPIGGSGPVSGQELMNAMRQLGE
jgi:SAM-dependent methyltransferase